VRHTIVVATLVLCSACGGRAGSRDDAAPPADGPGDRTAEGAADSSAAQPVDTAPPVDAAAAADAGPRDVGSAEADGARADTSDAGPAFACNLDCPQGPCPARAGHAPLVVATNQRPVEHFASLAAGGGEIYVGTISSDVFARGQLLALSLTTGLSSVLDPSVQASRILLDGDTLLYVGDAVQSPASTLFAISRHGGTRVARSESDGAFGGFAARDSVFPNGRVFYEAGMGPHAQIRSDDYDGDSSESALIVEVPDVPHGFAIDANSIYFASGDAPSSLSRHRYDEFTATSILLTTSDGLVGRPVVTGADLYYLNQHAAGDCAGAVMVIPTMGGTPARVSLGRSGSDASSLAVDGAYVYWTTFDAGGVVFRAARGGGMPEIIATGQREARAVTFDDARVYWLVTDASGGQVHAVDK
jgi:hypothetical protein